MAKRIILALAGSGKTFSLCQNVVPDQKALLLAFTRANIHNITSELVNKFKGCRVPEKISVMTFHSFVYRYAVSPYVKTIAEFFPNQSMKLGGVTDREPPTQKRYTPKGVMTCAKYNKDNLLHYVDENGRFYLKTLCELVLYAKKRKLSLLKDVARAVNMFWRIVMVDEFQDFREYEFEFLLGLAKLLDEVVLVGDYYQHSVAAIANSGKPFRVKKSDVSYADFSDSLRRMGFVVDDTSLKASRRCPETVCKFVREKLGIDIESCTDRTGNVKWVRHETDVDNILSNDKIIKLVYEDARKMPFVSRNWSYSKGDTYQNTCVILTGSVDCLENNYPDSLPKSQITTNKLYVALTRTAGNLYLINSATYYAWRKRHGYAKDCKSK